MTDKLTNLKVLVEQNNQAFETFAQISESFQSEEQDYLDNCDKNIELGNQIAILGSFIAEMNIEIRKEIMRLHSQVFEEAA